MTQMILTTRVGPDGVLSVPLGAAEANQEVRVTIESAGLPGKQSHKEYLEFLRATAGAWQGDFERPKQGEYEARDPL